MTRARRHRPRIRALGALVAVVGASACGDAAPGSERPPPPSVTFGGPSVDAGGAGTSAPAVTAAPGESVPTGGSDSGSTSTEPAPSAPRPTPDVDLVTVGTFDEPVDLAARPGDTTIYVVERPGRVLPVRNGVVGAPVLDITALTTTTSERGLLGLTFSADGTLAYVHHTDTDGDSVVAEYTVGDDDGIFDPTTRRELLTVEQPYPNHNGGGVAIGPDGMLYIALGDGGSADDPLRTALDVSSLLGKILRIDPRPLGARPYRVPADNPFVGVAGAAPEVWAVGLRNPWRFSFDPLTGDLWIADVGQNEWEEIDVARAAADGTAGRGWNFGWSAYEASARFNTDQPTTGAVPPVYEYGHGDAGCSVSGGVVARDASVPELDGWYVFGDFCSGRVSAIDVSEADTVRAVITLAEATSVVAVRHGPDGGVYVLSFAGDVWKLTGR